MKALIFDAAGAAADVLRLAEVAPPAARAGEVLIAVEASPINPADLAFVRGDYRLKPSFPQVAGLEGAGWVTAAGSGAEAWVGRRVAFRWPGAWAQTVAVPQERLIALPDDMDFAAGAQLALNPLTALGLLRSVGAAAGETIVLTAAASAVSVLVAQLAREAGVRTVGIVRGDAEAARGRSACDALVSSDESDLVERLKALSGAPLVGLLDSVGGPLVPRLMPALAAGARLVAYGVQDPAPMSVTNAMLIYGNLTWIGFGIDRWLAAQGADGGTAVATVRDLVAAGRLSLPVKSRHPLADFAAALDDNGQAGRSGNVLLTPQEP